MLTENFEKLTARHRDAVYAQLVRMCGNRDDAEDVLVDSLLKAYRASDSLENPDAFRGWLVQIGRRTCGRLKKRESMRPVVGLERLYEFGFEPVAVADSPEQVALETEIKTCLLDAVEALPVKYREAYILREVDQKTNEEAAAELGVSVEALKSRILRARALVRTRVDVMFQSSQ